MNAYISTPMFVQRFSIVKTPSAARRQVNYEHYAGTDLHGLMFPMRSNKYVLVANCVC